jgi:tellurite resistance protein
MNVVHACVSAPSSRLATFPVSFFAMVMGLSGLTIAARKVELGLGFSGNFSLCLLAMTAVVFSLLAATYCKKVWLFRGAVLAEWADPVQIAFFPTASISLILLGTASEPVNLTLAGLLWTVGSLAHLVVTVSVITAWINHSHYEVSHLNPSWFIPVVGNILIPIAGVHFAPPDVSWFFFSIGLVFGLVLLSIVFYRLIFHSPLPGLLVPTLFILLAPPSCGFIAWTSLTGDVGAFGRVLYFTALFILLLMLPQLPKFARQNFAPSWWAFSFPLAAFTIATLVMSEHDGGTVYTWAGRGLFCLLAVVITGLAGRTALGFAAR